RSVSQEMSTIIVYRTKKRLVKSGKDRLYYTLIFSQLEKNFFLTGNLFFPNWGKNARLTLLSPLPGNPFCQNLS
ncbi:hypothetical protein, partial [Bacteroides ndongoniae]|uniref:hypothetical protein n=1 Tax=Bacteroides ndongoniae TaxID=1903262 RepID=UPI0023F925BD